MKAQTLQKKNPYLGLWGFLKERGRLLILLGGLLVGIVLIVLGGRIGEKSENSDTSNGGEDLSALQAYETTLEKELEAICESVAGVGHAQVMVHLEGGTQIKFATDKDGKTVTVGTGSAQSALQSSLLSPTVAGVGVVCRGGNDPGVQKKLVELVSTTLGISANRVFVTGK